MFLNSGLTTALDRIAERAADVRRAYTPGAIPRYDDVATPAFASDFTLDPLAVTAPDGAYFVTRDNESARCYTRDGAFALRDGRLVGPDGQPIMGQRPGADDPTELRVDPVDAALGRVAGATIENDGTLSYRRDAIDPRTGVRASQRVVAGRLLLARFPAGTRLVTNDGTHCTPPAGVVPQTGLPDEGEFGAVAAMRRERSRVDIDESLIRLKEAYLAFDALQAAETAKGHLGKTVMDLLK
jgi:flagellar basal body rod protein FlgG